jgi:hypothetical protein
MGRRPAPAIKLRYTLNEAREALLLPKDAPIEQYAAAAGIQLANHESLSEAQLRAISDYIDDAMSDPETARFLAAKTAALRANPPVRRRGGLNPEAIRKVG